MDLLGLSIRNFLTIGQADLKLANRGLLLIQGDNRDDSSTESNGAGKSALVDALCWCDYGVTAREVSGDAVVNNTARQDCMVETLWADGPLQYRISRFRKHKLHKNALRVWQIDAAGAELELTRGTERETQDVIDKIMGCPLDVFVGAIYAGQEKMPDLPNMTDKHLKLLIEEAAGVSELSEAYLEAGRRLNLADKAHVTLATHVKALAQRALALAAEHASAQAEQGTFERGRRDRARLELGRVPALEHQRAAMLAEAGRHDGAALSARQHLLNAELGAQRAQQSQLDALARTEREKGDTVTRFRATVAQLKTALEHSEKMARELGEQVGKPCRECGKPYAAHDLASVCALRADSVTLAKKTLLKAAQGCKEAQTVHAAAAAAVAAFRAGMTDVSAASSELAATTAALTSLAKLETAIKLAERDIEAAKLAARNRMSEANPWDKAVETKAADQARTATELAAAQARCAGLERELALHQAAAGVFGPAGVRAHILDTVTPFLNEKTADYLGALTDGNITALWSTLAKNAKGELREKFNIDVQHAKGGSSFKALSGGEKRKVRVASVLALQDMVAARAGKPIRLFIGDEIDDALDEPGLERLMGVLDQKAKERGTVLVISHNALSDWCDQIITVTRSGGLANVSGATEHGF